MFLSGRLLSLEIQMQITTKGEASPVREYSATTQTRGDRSFARGPGVAVGAASENVVALSVVACHFLDSFLGGCSVDSKLLGECYSCPVGINNARNTIPLHHLYSVLLLRRRYRTFFTDC